MRGIDAIRVLSRENNVQFQVVCFLTLKTPPNAEI